jgi:hypothetical protein
MPDWNAAIASRLARLALRPAREREIVDELSQHLDDRYHELRASGTPHDEAVRLALVELHDEINDEDLLAREMRPLRQSSMAEPIPPGGPGRGAFADTWQDLVYAARMLRKNPGFAAAAILTLALGIGANTAIFSLVNATLLQRLPVQNRDRLLYTRAQGREFYQRVIDRMAQMPGVKSASVARIAVLTGGARVTTIAVEGRPDSGNRAQSEGGGFSTTAGQTALANVIGPEFFTTLGIPIVKGRDFSAQDTESHPQVAIVSETMAKQFFPGEDPIGKRFTTAGGGANGPWIEIVGISRDSKYAALGETPSPVVYLPLAQRHETGVTLYVRANVPPGPLVARIRREIQVIEPNLPVPNIQTMNDTIGTSLYAPRMGAMLLTVFGALALLLASLGVYGVLAFSISRRTREIGIRMALGADRRSVFALVIREGMWLVGIGLAIGLGAGLYAAESIKSFLFDVSTRDVTTFTSVPCALAAVALVACYVPARRAMRVDPMVALRDG